MVFVSILTFIGQLQHQVKNSYNIQNDDYYITSLAAQEAHTHHLQCQNGHQGGPNWPMGSIPSFLGTPINFGKISLPVLVFLLCKK